MENTSSAAGAREPVTKQQSTVLMGPLKPYRPQSAWKSTSVGFIPNPTTPRAEFMNSLLPEFYKSKFNHCKNAKQFVKEFHGTGRELYHSKQQIDEIDKQINSMMNKQNPAAAGVVLDKDYTLVPSDSIRINNNIQRAKQISSNLSSTDSKRKTLDSKLFSSTGKLKSGEEATHKFFEKQLGEVVLLHRKVTEINNQLTGLQEKFTRLFKVTYSKSQSRKRKQKQNKRKAKRAKQNRMEANCKQIIRTIAPQRNDSDAEPIGPLELHQEGIIGLKKRQLHYIQYAFDKELFTVAAKDTIKQYMTFSMSEIEEDDSDGSSADARDGSSADGSRDYGNGSSAYDDGSSADGDGSSDDGNGSSADGDGSSSDGSRDDGNGSSTDRDGSSADGDGSRDYGNGSSADGDAEISTSEILDN